MHKGVSARLLDFNADRIPTLRAIKYKKMRTDAFTFFRGSCHLFYEDLPADSILNNSPLSWSCGDVHVENFGSYLGSDDQAYFNINDFDEGALAPCAWDAARFITSLILAADVQKMPSGSASNLSIQFLDTYFQTLSRGQTYNVEYQAATGMVKKLFQDLKTRSRRDFLDDLSKEHKKIRKLKTEHTNFLPISAAEENTVTEIIHSLAKRENRPDFFRIHDIVFRIAGTGSLGMQRYAVLIEGSGSPDNNIILDIKEARSSSLTPFLQIPQPEWKTPAERVTTIQKFIQAVPPDLLTCADSYGKSFVVKEYQPSQDRISLDKWGTKHTQAQELIITMAKILAWGQLRSSGRQDSAAADDLMMYGKLGADKEVILKFALSYAHQVRKDYQQFAEAYDHGDFK